MKIKNKRKAYVSTSKQSEHGEKKKQEVAHNKMLKMVCCSGLSKLKVRDLSVVYVSVVGTLMDDDFDPSMVKNNIMTPKAAELLITFVWPGVQECYSISEI